MDHQLTQGCVYGHRAAAYHKKEGYGDWTVEGHHWMKYPKYSYPHQIVSDCSIYDGWWG